MELYRPPRTIILQHNVLLLTYVYVYMYDKAVVHIIHLDCQRVKD